MWFFFWIAFAMLVAVYAGHKGHSAVGFFFLSLFLTPLIGFLIAAVMSPDREQVAERSGLKKWPDCAEYVQGEAQVCRFCGHKFTENPEVKDKDDAVTRAMLKRLYHVE
jgi:hypothetical protein